MGGFNMLTLGLALLQAEHQGHPMDSLPRIGFRPNGHRRIVGKSIQKLFQFLYRPNEHDASDDVNDQLR